MGQCRLTAFNTWITVMRLLNKEGVGTGQAE